MRVRLRTTAFLVLFAASSERASARALQLEQPSECVSGAGAAAIASSRPLKHVASVPEISASDHESLASPGTLALLQWAASHHQLPPSDSHFCANCFLVVGVKSSAVSGFHERHTIRETWGNPTAAQESGARLVFLGCEPAFDDQVSQRDRNRVLEALAEEKRIFGDLLTHELSGCADSYYSLVDKTLGFLRWTARHYPLAAYAMVADDDTYVRIDKLVEMLKSPSTPSRRFYGGQVWATQFKTTIRPIRGTAEKNYVSPSHYAMSTFPAFASGPQYVLSADLVRFLARNSDHLRGVGSLEDVSVAYWLRALLQLAPFYLDVFDDIRFALCHNMLVSYTNLSPSGMRAIHANLIGHRSFCTGFSFTRWAKSHGDAPLPPLTLAGPGRQQTPIVMQWDARFDPLTRVALIVVTLEATKTNESATAVYVPSHIPFIRFCRELLHAANVTMTTTALSETFVYELRDEMAAFLRTSSARAPAMKVFFTLALANLHQGIRSAAVFVRLSRGAIGYRSLIENLMATMYSDAHIYVLSERDYGARFGHLAPDFHVLAGSEYTMTSTSPTNSRTRHIVFDCLTSETMNIEDHHAVWICDRFSDNAATPMRRLHVPQASLEFMNRTKHTPLELLTPRTFGQGLDEREFMVVDPRGLAVVATSTVEILTNALREEALSIASLQGEDHEVAMSLDEQVVAYSQFKFALVVEDRFDLPGHISSTMVTAFLAGCIPVYVGHHPTIIRVFNHEAFISCHAFHTFRKCAQHVVKVHRTPSAYESIRAQPPVGTANAAAFYEAFSWHPAVYDVSPNHFTMASRLKRMLESVKDF